MSLGAESRSLLFLLSPLPLSCCEVSNLCNSLCCSVLTLRLLILRGTTSVSLCRLVFDRYLGIIIVTVLNIL